MNSPTVAIGGMINRYRLDEDLGGSEIARVFRAHDTRLSRDVALKLVTHSQEYSAGFVESFLKEARALARLTHPNIARVLDFGQDQGYLYLISEFIEGKSLEAQLALGKPVDWREVVQLLLPITEALESAHQAGIIHRGLKPSNILITSDNRPVITDFSIARILEAEETREMTGTHVGLGSPFYMSPEQGKGLNVDDRADIYSLGTIFFEWVTDSKPFASGSSMEIVIQQVSTPPPLPSQFVPDLPEAIERVILTMLCKDRDERFQTMMEVTEALREVLTSGAFAGRARRKKSSLRMWITAMVSLLLVAGMITGGLSWAKLWPFAPTPVPTAISALPTATLRPTRRPTETRAPTRTAVPTQQATATPTMVPKKVLEYNYPELPVLEATRLPGKKPVISPENAPGLVELARWGSPVVRAIAWSWDDQHLYAATSGGMYIYSAKDLSPVRFFDAGGSLTALAVSDDNQRLVTGDETGMVRLWDPLKGELIAEMPGHTGPITALDFSSTGDRIVSASKDRTARLWEGSGQPVAHLKRHGLPVTGAVFLKGDAELVTTSEDFKILRWNSDTGELISEYTSRTRILDAALGEDEGHVVVVSSGPAVEFWDLNTPRGSIISTFDESTSGTLIQALALSPNFTLAATASGDGQVRVWNSGGVLMWSLQAEDRVSGQKATPLTDVAFSHDATQLAGVGQNGVVTVWELSSRERIAQSPLLPRGILGISATHDNRYLAAQYADGVTQWFRMNDGEASRSFIGRLPNGVPAGRISQTNDMVAVARKSENSGENVLALEHVSSSSSIELVGYSGGVVRFLSNNTMVAVGASRSLGLWSIHSFYRLVASQTAYQDNCQVAFDNEEKLLAAGSELGVFVNEATYPFYCKLRKVPYAVDWAYVDDQGKWFAFGLSTGFVELWTLNERGTPVSQRFAVEGGSVMSVALSPDENLLVTGSADGKIRVWDIATQTMLVEIGKHTQDVTDLLFSEDGSKIISASSDGSMEVWGLAD